MALSLLERIKQKALQTIFNPSAAITQGAPIGQAIVDLGKGFFGEREAVGERRFGKMLPRDEGGPFIQQAQFAGPNPDAKFAPQNTAQNIGAGIYPFLEELFAGGAGGINTAVDDVFKSVPSVVRSSPFLASKVGAVDDLVRGGANKIFGRGGEVASEVVDDIVRSSQPVIDDAAEIVSQGPRKTAELFRPKAVNVTDDIVRASTPEEQLAQVLVPEPPTPPRVIPEGANVPLKTSERYFAKPSSKTPDFMVNADGSIVKVTKGGKRTSELFKQVEPNVLPSSGEVLPLPAGPSSQPIKKLAAGPETLSSGVTRASVPGNQFAPKSTGKKAAEALFGNKRIEGSKGIIRNSGPAGEMIVKLIDNADKQASHLAGQATQSLETALKKLSKNEVDTFADVVEGRITPLSPVQEEAVNTWRAIAQDVQQKAQEVGIDMGVIENYFPHQVLEMSKAQQRQFAEQLVSQGKYKTVAEALQAIQNEASSLGRNAPRRFGNLELSREANLPYNKSPNVLFDYVKNAYGRIADAANFGTADEKLYELAKAAGTQGGDTVQIAQYLDQILGKNQVASKIGQKLTGLQTIVKLNPATSFTNLTQNLSTLMRTDIPSMTKAMARVISNPKQAFANATKVGEISPDMARQLADYTGGGKATQKWIRLIGMEGTEKFNRVMAVNTGMEYAKSLGKQAAKGSQAAIRELERLGVSADDLRGGMTDDLAAEVGRKISRMTQFSTKAGELPYAWRTESGKVLTQFKSFAYKQTGFLKEQAGRVASEAGKGNIKPLINSLVTLGVAAPIAGEIVNDFKSLIRNKKRTDTDTLTERYISNILGATSFGLLDSTGALFGQYGSSGVVGVIGGPTVSDAEKVISGVADLSSAARGEDTDLKPVARDVIKSIPGAGQTLSNTLIPNSFVDNYVGVNNGLNRENNELYLAMKQADPTAAERFKSENQQMDKPQEGQNFIEKLFGPGGQKFDWNTAPTSKKAKTEFNKQVDTALDAGAEIPDKALNTRFFEGGNYKKATSNKEKEEVMKAAMKVAEDEYLTPEQKAKIVNTAGINPGDLDYYRLATMDENDKIAGVLEFVGSGELDRDQLISTLALNKRRVAGKYITTPAVLERLYDEGYISKDDKSLLGAIKWDSVYDKFYMDRDYKGGSGGLTPAKVKSYVKSVNSIFKVTTQTKSTAPKSIKLPKAPRIRTLSPLTK